MTLPWYPKDMGKYARDTGHLSLVEHGAYNLLLDYYYSKGSLLDLFEQCSSNGQLMVDNSRAYLLCKAMTKAEQQAVDTVLKRFFPIDGKGRHRNKRADEIIETQTEKHETRVRVGTENRRKAFLKQCSSNAVQTQTKTKKETQGAFHSEKLGEKKAFSIDLYLKDADRSKAREAAPQWDQQLLMREYDQRVNVGVDGVKFDRPKAPAPAYIGWCAKFTKGNPP